MNVKRGWVILRPDGKIWCDKIFRSKKEATRVLLTNEDEGKLSRFKAEGWRIRKAWLSWKTLS